MGWEHSPGTLLMAESRPDFLKGPLLVSLQNSGAYGFVSMQFATLDFPAESKKSAPRRTGGKKKTPHLNSDDIAKFLPAFST